MMERAVASEELQAEVFGALVTDMTRVLVGQHVNLKSDVAVIYALARAGFGLPAVEQLRDRAVRKAAEVWHQAGLQVLHDARAPVC